MPKYEVIRPWHGVSVGQVFETDRLHSALKSNVREVMAAGNRVEVDLAVTAKQEAGKILAEAAHQVDTMREQAQAELAQRVEEAKHEAQAEADRIISEATAEAERIKQDAQQKVGELTPATPDAGSKQTKTK
ncbi:hypothetical protein MTR80_06295 [Alcaligenes aquatilis]|uniref:Uncharacterized protein n=1 Tax=Alcaligenes aquatilis TaxID=323284 RepID=A0ABY4NLV3_9BURK|nr:hypothetical protein [Alcaligenes aquatilis]UQN37312.1 hypothetical protein MTR80_06295 [Alcaligenes aquatilis]